MVLCRMVNATRRVTTVAVTVTHTSNLNGKHISRTICAMNSNKSQFYLSQCLDAASKVSKQGLSHHN
jgi:hypothetical protein